MQRETETEETVAVKREMTKFKRDRRFKRAAGVRQRTQLRHSVQTGLPGLSIPSSAGLTGAALAVSEDVLQPLLQLIRPFPLQMQLPLEVLELWGDRKKDVG